MNQNSETPDKQSRNQTESYGGDRNAFTVINGRYIELHGASGHEAAMFGERHTHADQWARRS